MKLLDFLAVGSGACAGAWLRWSLGLRLNGGLPSLPLGTLFRLQHRHQCGRDAGQTIPHLHLPLIPRYGGDIAEPRGGVRGVIPDKQKY